MNAVSYFNKAHRALPADISKWHEAMPRVLATVPDEVRDEVREYLRGMYRREQVAARERAKPGSLASKKAAK